MRVKTAIFAVLICLITPCFAQFVDVSIKDEAYSAVRKLLRHRIIELPADRKFNGESTVNMYQLAFILDRILAYTGRLREIEALPVKEFYTDVPSGHHAYKAVRDLVKLGLFAVPPSRKFNGEVKLDRFAFYSYFAAFIERVEGGSLPLAPPEAGYVDVSSSDRAYSYIQKLVGAGLLEGKGRLEGKMPMSRYEMAVFVAKFLDFYAPQTAGPAAGTAAVVAGYVDIPEDNYAAGAIAELVEVGVLSPAREARFYGDDYIDRYYLVDLIAKVIEKIVVGEVGELPLASPARAYKDVPFSHYAYRSIQKLIALNVIPAGNRTELFFGDRRITRYQMVYFSFTALEEVLSRIIAFQEAPAELGYGDVPPDNFVYDNIQKLIWLGVLEGGEDNSFKGEEFVNRYELSYFMVSLIKAIYIKLEEAEEVVYEEPVEYGFNMLFNTQLSALQITGGKGPGEDLNDLSAYQRVSVYVERRLSEALSAFASFASSYNFGSATASTPSLNEAYILYSVSPFFSQAGRAAFYHGYTPFGNSIFVDTTADMILGGYDHDWFSLDSAVGKLWYSGDITLDSNFGIMSMNPKLPPYLNWLELTLGGSLITDLPDPSFTQTLPTRLTQIYGGIKIDLFSVFELTAENARLDFSDPDVLPFIGYSDKDDFEAAQYCLTYFAEDYGYSISLGYQAIGDDYYLSTLASPADFLGGEQGTESLLFKSRFYPSPSQTIGVDLASVTQDHYNIRNVISGNYNLRLFESAYLDVALAKTMDNTTAHQDQLSASSSFSVSF